jgi:hypothetical protein
MLNREKALEIAMKELERRQKLSNYNDFSPVEIHEENDLFWTFVSGSEAMFEDGYVPGAFFVSVDKTDGHIWTRSETENYYQQNSIPELQTA